MSAYAVVHSIHVIVHPLFKPLTTGNPAKFVSLHARRKIKAEVITRGLAKLDQYLACQVGALELLSKKYREVIDDAALNSRAVAFLEIPREQFELARKPGLGLSRETLSVVDAVDAKHEFLVKYAVEKLGSKCVVLKPEDCEPRRLAKESVGRFLSPFGGVEKAVRQRLQEKGWFLHPKADVLVSGENRHACVQQVFNAFKHKYARRIVEEKCL